MDFTLTNDQTAIKSMVQSFAKEKMEPFANKWDQEKTLPVDVLREAANLGLGGIYIPEKLGGTGLNRLDASISNLTTLQVNTDAARSRIEDADFAAETTNMTKAQILSQAATSMLAQANASKQNLLSLLQG